MLNAIFDLVSGPPKTDDEKATRNIVKGADLMANAAITVAAVDFVLGA
jgi:hypothetical protein